MAHGAEMLRESLRPLRYPKGQKDEQVNPDTFSPLTRVKAHAKTGV